MRLGIVSIQRDRAAWIKEWVAFHHLVGCRKFYIFLHRCSDNTPQVVNSLKKHFDIKVFVVPEDADRPQLGCYQFAYQEFGHEVDWMAFIDGDEFLYPTSGGELTTYLEEYSYLKISALGVYWSCFGSSGHIEEPEGLILENYRYRGELNMPLNRHIKSIVLGRQGSLVAVGPTPHIFKTPLGTYDEQSRPVTAWQANHHPSHEKFRINHYITQSRRFYENFKRGAGTATDDYKKPLIRPESWWIESDRNEVYDPSMDAYIDPVRTILGTIEL